MKVTALLPDDLIDEVKVLAHGKNITDSLLKALREWVALQNVKKLNSRISRQPLQFAPKYTAKKIRDINRVRY